MPTLATAETRRSGDPDLDVVREEKERLEETEELDAPPREDDEPDHEESDGE